MREMESEGNRKSLCVQQPQDGAAFILIVPWNITVFIVINLLEVAIYHKK